MVALAADSRALMLRQLYLEKLASAVVYRIRPNRGDRESVQDCMQEAWLAGLQALRSADRNGERPSKRYIWLSMQQAVYRLLHREGLLTLGDESNQECDRSFDRIDAEEFVAVHLQCLSAKERRVVDQYFSGVTAKQIAGVEGITTKGVYFRLREAMGKLRVAAGLLPAAGREGQAATC